MRNFLAVLSVMVLSTGAMASVTCEKKLIENFVKLEIKPDEVMDTQDYTNPEMEYLGKKAYSKISMEEFQKTLDEAKKYEVKDTRANEAIRVCSSIKAYAKMGLSSKEIYIKTLAFQNGWSNGMREPLESLIQTEVDGVNKLPAEIGLAKEAKASAFCLPNNDESECATADGRVYKLDKSVNQLGRNIAKENIAVPEASVATPAPANKTEADDLATLGISK